jgi:hypothetical protein
MGSAHPHKTKWSPKESSAGPSTFGIGDQQLAQSELLQTAHCRRIFSLLLPTRPRKSCPLAPREATFLDSGSTGFTDEFEDPDIAGQSVPN